MPVQQLQLNKHLGQKVACLDSSLELRERPFDFQGGGGGVGFLVRLEYFFCMFSETEFFFQHHRGLEFFFFQCMMREAIFFIVPFV